MSDEINTIHMVKERDATTKRTLIVCGAFVGIPTGTGFDHVTIDGVVFRAVDARNPMQGTNCGRCRHVLYTKASKTYFSQRRTTK